jgi:hypothetical protein
MRGDFGIDKCLTERLEIGECAFFVATHQTTIAGHIRRQSPFNAFAGQRSPQIGVPAPRIKAYRAVARLGPPTSETVESRMGAVAWGQWPTPRFPSHRVAGGGRPPLAPTERGVRISRTTLFGSWFTAFTAICSSFVSMVS